MNLSPQQQAVITWALEAQGHLNLVARAGCGKTTTLLEVVKAIAKAKPDAEIFLGAYNKAIADEISSKLAKAGLNSRSVRAGTMHSAGFSAWRYVAKNVKVDGHKVRDLVRANYGEQLPEAGSLVQLVSLAKQRGIGALVPVGDTHAWYELVEHHGVNDLETISIDQLVTMGQHILNQSLALDRDIIDFDDMVLAPLAHKARIWPKDFVLIDEAQDTNAARRALALAMLGKNGRMIAVGDPAQAIYGFTGADSDSMDLIKASLNSQELPLNVTYRCPKAVVALANQWVPDLVAHPDAPEGKVGTVALSEAVFAPEDAVLCRLNKPLVDMAYGLIRRGIACRVEGREIGTGLITLARRWKLATLDALDRKLDDYCAKETAKWLAKDKPERASAVEDKVMTLKTLIERLLSEGKTAVTDLTAWIESVFEDSDKSPRRVLTLASIHKSKGREWPRVYWLDRAGTCPSKWARREWQQAQERNLMYVAATRAQAELWDLTV